MFRRVVTQNGLQPRLMGTLQNLSYSWDSAGNLQSRNSARVSALGVQLESLNEAYTYDNLNRVKTVTASGIDATKTTRTYTYDALGNLTADSSLTPNALTYPATGNVYGVKTAGGKTYGYDAYGNVITRGTDTNAYDVFNKPTQLGLVKFFYGPNGEKYKQVNLINGGVTTWYFNNGIYEYQQGPGTKDTVERTYAGSYLYSCTANQFTGFCGDYYQLHDHLGSVDTITESTGRAYQQMSFDAFGKRRLSNWKVGDPVTTNFLTSQGYTGHDQLDNLGLIHMGGVYDPAIGRFLSADLFVQSPYDSQSFNRYSYVRNNPLGRVDPTGYEEVQEVVVIGVRETGIGAASNSSNWGSVSFSGQAFKEFAQGAGAGIYNQFASPEAIAAGLINQGVGENLVYPMLEAGMIAAPEPMDAPDTKAGKAGEVVGKIVAINKPSTTSTQ